jgi:hypothetical protein
MHLNMDVHTVKHTLYYFVAIQYVHRYVHTNRTDTYMLGVLQTHVSVQIHMYGVLVLPTLCLLVG